MENTCVLCSAPNVSSTYQPTQMFKLYLLSPFPIVHVFFPPLHHVLLILKLSFRPSTNGNAWLTLCVCVCVCLCFPFTLIFRCFIKNNNPGLLVSVRLYYELVKNKFYTMLITLKCEHKTLAGRPFFSSPSPLYTGIIWPFHFVDWVCNRLPCDPYLFLTCMHTHRKAHIH